MDSSKNLKLTNPPIKEAVLTSRFVYEQDQIPCGDSLIKIADGLKHAYPQKKEAFNKTFEINIEDGEAPPLATQRQDIGFLLTTEDKKKNIRIMPEELVLGHLEPYSSGNDLLNDFKDAWNVVLKQTSPIYMSHIALRFVNELTLPQAEIAKHLKAPPVFPKLSSDTIALNSSVAQFGLTDLANQQYGGKATFVIAPQKSNASELKIIIDIEVGRIHNEIKCETSELENTYQKLRSMKNDVFFSSFHNAKELFS